MRDLFHNILTKSAIAPQSVTGDTTGTIIDTLGFESITFSLNVGAFSFTSTDKLTVEVYEGNTDNLSDAAEVAATKILGTVPVLDAAGDASTTHCFGVMTNKRYLRIDLVEGDNGNVTVLLSAIAILGHPQLMPSQE